MENKYHWNFEEFNKRVKKLFPVSKLKFLICISAASFGILSWLVFLLFRKMFSLKNSIKRRSNVKIWCVLVFEYDASICFPSKQVLSVSIVTMEILEWNKHKANASRKFMCGPYCQSALIIFFFFRLFKLVREKGS